MKYNFDEINDRFNTGSIKWDGQRYLNEDFNDQTICLQVADMDFKTANIINDRLRDVCDRGIYGYTSYLFKDEYKEGIRFWFKEYFDLDIEDDEIIYSNGSLQLMRSVIETFSEEGDGVIIQRPVYGHFNQVIEDEAKRNIVNNQMINEDGQYYIDFDDLKEKCEDPKNKILVFCSPQNPVGRLWTKEEIRKVHDLTLENDMIFISDEVHCDLVRDGNTHLPIYKCIDDYSNVVMLTAISKTFNLRGLKCANGIIKDGKLREKIKEDFGFRNPTPFGLEALIGAYTREGREWLDQLNEYLDSNFDFLEKFLRENMPGVKFKRPQGTYMVWLDFSSYGLTYEEIHERIYKRANVILQDGLVHDKDRGGQFQRMCLCSPRSMIEKALIRISKEF